MTGRQLLQLPCYGWVTQGPNELSVCQSPTFLRERPNRPALLLPTWWCFGQFGIRAAASCYGPVENSFALGGCCRPCWWHARLVAFPKRDGHVARKETRNARCGVIHTTHHGELSKRRRARRPRAERTALACCCLPSRRRRSIAATFNFRPSSCTQFHLCAQCRAHLPLNEGAKHDEPTNRLSPPKRERETSKMRQPTNQLSTSAVATGPAGLCHHRRRCRDIAKE